MSSKRILAAARSGRACAFHRAARAPAVCSRVAARLPLVRVQPVHFQGTIEATWHPVLEQIAKTANCCCGRRRSDRDVASGRCMFEMSGSAAAHFVLIQL